MAADQRTAAGRHRAGRRRDSRRRVSLLSRDAGHSGQGEGCPAYRRTCASGATTMAFPTSSPVRWTTPRARSAICMRASGCTRWRSGDGVGQGRLAEIPGAERVGVDKFIRTLGLYREAESSFSALSPWAQKRLQAYADGVNAFLANHALPPSFLLAGDRPEPWKPADSLVIGSFLPTSCRRTSSSSSCAPELAAKLGEERQTGL